MILLDLSGTMFAALHVDISKGAEPTKEYIRHLVFNSIRFYNITHRNDYGEMVIAMDDKSWRYDDFEWYKWERNQDKETDGLDWDVIYGYMNEITAEIIEHLPYPCVRASGAEADDVIGVLAKKSDEPVLIVSNDKDLVELTRKPNVKMWRPYDNAFYSVDDCDEHLLDLILRGDKADGIPNVRSPEDFYVQAYKSKAAGEKPTRAKPINKALKAEMLERYKLGDKAMMDYLGEEMWERFVTNRRLIDLSYIPTNVTNNILSAWDNVTRNPEMKLIAFLSKHRMSLLAKNVSEFRPVRGVSAAKPLFG